MNEFDLTSSQFNGYRTRTPHLPAFEKVFTGTVSTNSHWKHYRIRTKAMEGVGKEKFERRTVLTKRNGTIEKLDRQFDIGMFCKRCYLEILQRSFVIFLL